MTTNTAPLTKSGCADDVGNTLSSADAAALPMGVGTEAVAGAAADAKGARDGEADGGTEDTDGDSDVAVGNIKAVQSLAGTARSPAPVSRRHSWKSGDGSFGVYWLGKNPITVWSS
jgi:hypothetical protein